MVDKDTLRGFGKYTAIIGILLVILGSIGRVMPILPRMTSSMPMMAVYLPKPRSVSLSTIGVIMSEYPKRLGTRTEKITSFHDPGREFGHRIVVPAHAMSYQPLASA